MFGVKSLIVAYATTAGEDRVKTMRRWSLRRTKLKVDQVTAVGNRAVLAWAALIALACLDACRLCRCIW